MPQLPSQAQQNISTGWADTAATSAPEPRQGRWVIPIGIRGATTRTLDLTRQQGLALVGPGSEPAARALLALMLDATDSESTASSPDPTAAATRGGAAQADVQVWTTAATAHRLTGRDPQVGSWPHQMWIHPDLRDLLGHVERELHRRYRLAADPAPIEPAELVEAGEPVSADGGVARVLLLVEPTEAEESRLRAVLAQGGGLNVGAVLLGDWPSGTTCQLAIDATVTDATSGSGTEVHELVTTRLWALTLGELAERLRLGVPSEPSNQPRLVGTAYNSDGGENDDHDGAHDGWAFDDRHDQERPIELDTQDEAEPEDDVDEPQRDEHGGDHGGQEEACFDESAGREGERGLVPESARLVVHCFGAPRVLARQDSAAALVEITEIVPAKQRLLLRCMASRPDGVLADELLEVGWPDSPLTAARRRLHTTLTQLRRTLAGHTGASTGTFAVMIGQRYHLTRPTPAPTAVDRTSLSATKVNGPGGGPAGGADQGAGLVWVDWWAFGSAVAAARATTGEARVDAWTRAARLYRGPLWPDEADIGWVEPLRHTASVEALEVLGQLAEHAERQGLREHAVAWLATGLDLHPTDEPTVEALIRLYHRAGRPELAHRAYTALAARLAAADLPGPDAATTAALHDLATAHP